MYWQSPKSVWEIKERVKLPKYIICVGNLGFVKHNINKNSGKSVVRKSWGFTKSYLLFPVVAWRCWHHVPAHAACKKAQGSSFCFGTNKPTFACCYWFSAVLLSPPGVGVCGNQAVSAGVSQHTQFFAFPSHGFQVQLVIKTSSVQGALDSVWPVPEAQSSMGRTCVAAGLTKAA